MQTQVWDTLWIDANIATMEIGSDYGFIKNAAIAIHKGEIVWLGPEQELPGKPEKLAEEVVTANGCCITPGLIDCHTHLVYSGNRADEFEQRLQGKTYQEIAKAGGGIHKTVAATRACSEEDLFLESLQRLRPLLSEGVTTIEIKSGYGLDEQTELKILRVIKRIGELLPMTVCPTFLGAHTLAPEYQGRADAYIDFICQHMIPLVKKNNLATAVDAFCDTIAFNTEQVERVFVAAKQNDLAVKIHAEQLSDQQGALLAAKYGALSADHLEYASEASIAAMAKSETVAVLLPGAFYFLAEKQRPPIDLLKRYQVPIAISTDCNPGSSPVTSLLLMLNMACVLFRMTPAEALAGVTRNAAQALGMLTTHGTLTKGKKADFVVWDIKHPLELVYNIGFNPHLKTIKNGMLVMHL